MGRRKLCSEVEELISAVETTFGASLDRELIRDDSTVEDLYLLLRAKLHRATSRGCMSATVCRRLRRAFLEVLGTPKMDFRRWVEMPFLLPPGSRNRVWKQIEEHSGLVLPKLVFHPALLLLFCLPGVSLMFFGQVGFGLVLLFLVPLFIGTLVLEVFRPLLNQIPDEMLTLELATRTVTVLNYRSLLSEGYYSDRDLHACLCHCLLDARPTDTLEEVSGLLL